MSRSALVTPRLRRRAGSGIVFGVATAIAEHVGVPVRFVRLAFVLAVFASGLGLALYAVFFIVLPVEHLSTRPRAARMLENVLAVLVAAVVVVIAGNALPHAGLVLPLGLAGIGGALLWRQASSSTPASACSTPCSSRSGSAACRCRSSRAWLAAPSRIR